METKLDHEWRARLLAAEKRDRETRARLAATGDLFKGYHPEMEAVHLENVKLLEEAIAAIGWPGKGLVGEDGAGAAFTIAQHAISRPDFQRRAATLLHDAVAWGEADPLAAAFLTDRIAVMEGRGQIYGTQFDWDEKGEMSPMPLADPSKVEERRASVGLAPLATSIAKKRAAAALSKEKPPADRATRQAEFEAWARSVGWRA